MRGAADPFAIDTLFMYMANMSWNSAMNPAETTGLVARVLGGPVESASAHRL